MNNISVPDYIRTTGNSKMSSLSSLSSFSFDKDLSNLNPNQRRAVGILDGPLLISAGAGSGKTRVLTYRIALLIKQKKAHPHQILAVTFTNKAANEMKERVHNFIGGLKLSFPDRLWISTFHSLCARILKEQKKLISPDHPFTIYDGKDQLSLVKKVMKDLNINDQVYNPKTFANWIAFCKRKGLGPEHVDQNNFPAYGNRFQNLYFYYEKELKSAGAFDFEGLLLETYKLFLKYPEILNKYQEQFKYISVDEYQDTNHIQYLIIKTLSEKQKNICVVGDEDQSIYAWRGADISNILNFEKDFPSAKIIKLEQNYRSTQNIIFSAGALISHNSMRKQKKLWTNKTKGQPLQVYELEDEYQEAHLIANTVEDHCHNQSGSYQDFAVFYRTNAQSRVLESALRSKGIPYKVTGSLKFYDRLEIKDILSYMKVILNTNDEVSLKRIINSPKRGIGLGAVQNISKESQRRGKSFYETMKYLSETNQVRGSARAGIMEFIHIIDYLQSVRPHLSLSELYQRVLEKTKYQAVLKANNSIESLSRVDNLQELGSAIKQFEMENEESSLEMFLEEMALLAPSAESGKENSDSVSLMTLHVSKGLEFNTVFMAGMEEGLCPLSSRVDTQEAEDSLEEERRLVYVGMTRAKNELFLSYAIKRNRFGKTQYNQASSFLDEIPDQFIHFTSLTQKKHKIRKKYNAYQKSEKPWFSSAGAESVAMEENSSNFLSRFQVGCTVHHPHFGAGKIQKLEGEGENLKISVIFKNQRVKKFIAKYAHLSL